MDNVDQTEQQQQQQQQPPPPPQPNQTLDQNVVQCFNDFSSQLKQAFPQVPAQRFEVKACVLAKTTNSWLDQIALYFDEVINEEMQEAIKHLTEQKKLEEKDAEVSNKIVEYASETIARFERLAKTIPQIEKTIQAKTQVQHQLNFLEKVKKKFEGLKVTDTLQEAENEAAQIINLVDKIQ